MKTYYIHCGNYRHFLVKAENKKQALKRFYSVKPAGFAKKDITSIEIKEGGE